MEESAGSAEKQPPHGLDEELRIADYDPDWPNAFAHQRELIEAALGDRAAGIHHFGSTSVIGMAAKPIIDILVESREEEMPSTELVKSALGGLRYEEIYADGRRTMFTKRDAPRCNLHVYLVGDPAIEEYLTFSDYLRRHPDKARQYEVLKRKLVLEHPNDIGSYTAGKEAFVKDTLQLARLSTWGAEGDLISQAPMDPELVSKVLNRQATPHNTWQEITKTRTSVTFNVYAADASEAARLIGQQVNDVKLGLSDYKVAVENLTDPHEVTDPADVVEGTPPWIASGNGSDGQ